MVGRYCGIVVLWYCGIFVVLYCGSVVLWFCGIVVLWHYGSVVLWYCGIVVLWYNQHEEVERFVVGVANEVAFEWRRKGQKGTNRKLTKISVWLQSSAVIFYPHKKVSD